MLYPITFCPKTRHGPKLLKEITVCVLALSDRLISHYISFRNTLLASCVNRIYNSNVTAYMLFLQILHYKVLLDVCHFYI